MRPVSELSFMPASLGRDLSGKSPFEKRQISRVLIWADPAEETRSIITE